MKNTHYHISFLLFLFLLISKGLLGQCTSEVGQLQNSIEFCAGDDIYFNYDGNHVFDENDTLLFLLHNGSADSIGEIFAYNWEPFFECTALEHCDWCQVSAVVGNKDTILQIDSLFTIDTSYSADSTFVLDTVTNITDTIINIDTLFLPDTLVTVDTSYYIDLSDTCLAISNPLYLDIMYPPFLLGPEVLVITDDQPTVTATYDCYGCSNSYWDNGITGLTRTFSEPGTYGLNAYNNCGWAYINVTVLLNPGTIFGQAIFDDNENCINNNETGINDWWVKVESANYARIKKTNADGSYLFPVPIGNYNVELVPVSDYWEENCGGFVKPTSIASANDSKEINFFAGKAVTCPLLSVDLRELSMRACLPSLYTVYYRNTGTEVATDAYIEVILDEHLTATGSDIPYTVQDENTYTFSIGDVGIGEEVCFTIEVMVSCDVTLGQSICSEAHIFPNESCSPIPSDWSGAEVTLNGVCLGDSIQLTIKNTGTGDMAFPGTYIVIEDGVILMNSPESFQLNAGESINLSYPSSGSTFTLQASQVPNYPGNSNPILTLEACGINEDGTFTTGYVTQFPLDENEESVAISCKEVVAPWDPNGKSAYPVGFGEAHYIEQNQPIEYTIYFQNTGTATAINVILHDIISPYLDITSIQPGPFSHPYTMDILGSDTLVFTFENIMLPDSNVNEIASHGFVNFTISQKENLPIETRITNEAAIYFDNNDAIITNEVFHTIGKDYYPIAPMADADFTAETIEDFEVLFHNESKNTNQYQWTFIDFIRNEEVNPIYTFPYSGYFDVTLVAKNYYSIDTLTKEILVEGPPTARIGAAYSSGCTPFTVQFSDNSLGLTGDRVWSFPGGTPNTSTSLHPIVTYENEGSYNVTLEASNPYGTTEIAEEAFIEVNQTPDPIFEIDIDGNTVIFNNHTTNADTYRWNFDDGSEISTEENPSHTYSTAGVYSATLHARNTACGASIAQTFQISIATDIESEHQNSYVIYPNPTKDISHIILEKPFSGEMILTNTFGQILQRQYIVKRNKSIIELEKYADGVYFLQLADKNGGRYVIKIIKNSEN